MTIAQAPLLADSILQRQIDTETDAVHQGVLRYRRLVEDAVRRGDAGQLKAVERVIAHWHRVMQVAIEDEFARWDAGEYRDGSHVAIPAMKQLRPEELSYIGLNAMLSHILEQHNTARLQRTCQAVGNAVIGEMHLRLLKERSNREAYRELTRIVRRLCPAKVNWWARKSLEDGDIAAQVALQIGAVFMRLAIDVCSAAPWEEKHRPCFHQWKQKEPGTTRVHRMIRLVDDVMDVIDEGHRVREILRPRFQPMLVQPYPWTDKGRGGYVRIATPFISGPRKEQKRALEDADLAEARDGLTAVAATPWRINPAILEVAEELWERGGGVPSMPLAEHRPLPPRIDFDTASREEKKRWRADASKVHRTNALENGHRSDFASRIGVARRFVDEDRIWFPHQFDFRGRVYPIPVWLNHQGDDLSRGLLLFAEQKPVDVGSPAHDRFLVHAANCWGLDKASFEARRQWTTLNLPNMLKVAGDPIGDSWWHEADKPWQFLACCFAARDGRIMAGLPGQMDGTCNGLQHYAAMTLDESGGCRVNLVDSDTPQDVYAEVARVVHDRNERNLAGGERRGLFLQGRIDRKLVKRVVMTSVYGVTEHGAARHMAEVIEEMFPGMDRREVFLAGIHMSKLTMASLGEVCTGAVRTMAWIRESASRICHANRKAVLQWNSPIGFPVVQPYRQWRASEVCTMVGRMKILHMEELDHPAMINRQINGSAPNFVHSVDAAHMLRTAIRANREGLAFAGVHDSFWTHFATADRLDAILREEFVRIHREPLLENLADQWRRLHGGVKLDDPPRIGTLDVDSVLRSRYFFS